MIHISEHTDIRKMTTFGLPAECGRFIEFDSPADLQSLYRDGILSDILPIGGGSNLLFTTGIYRGTAVHCSCADVAFGAPDTNGHVDVHAAAGCVLDHLCELTASRGLWGLENLSGIPGEIGGAAVQNVGAYGTEFKDTAIAVECFDTATGQILTLTNSDCAYGYRDSVFKHRTGQPPLIVTGVTLRLSTHPTPRLGYAALAERFASTATADLTPAMLRQAVIGLRDSKLPDPKKTGSAGSFFKNPVVAECEYQRIQELSNKPVPGHVLPDGTVKLSAAWLIDNAGCKSLSHGGAALWQSQPLVIVNATGHATGSDVVALERDVIRTVYSKFGITLEPEVVHI